MKKNNFLLRRVPRFLGYTLIELLVVLAVVAIVTLAATSSFYFSSGAKKAHTELIELKAALEYAKYQAITRSETVTVCPSEDGKTCDTKSWSKGVVIFEDKNADRSIETEDKVLRVLPALRDHENLVWRGFPNYAYLQFLPDGLMKGNNGTFVLCIGAGKNLIAQGLIISKTGRMRFTEGVGPIHKGSNGKLLYC